MKVIKILKPGWIFIFITISLGVGAINTGNNLVYLITAFLLGVMGASGFFGKKNLMNMEISIKTPDEIYANRDFPLEILLKNNKKHFHSYLIRVNSSYFNVIFPFINANSSEKKISFSVFKKRGFNKINRIILSSRFPFNFFERYFYLKNELNVLVYPEPVKANIVSYEFKQFNIKDNFISSYYKGSGSDLHLIRDFQTGDNIKNIHWKLTAKHNELKVKEFSKNEHIPIILDFDKIQINNIEKKISAITYFIINNNNVVLKIKDKILTNKKDMLTNLALY